LAAILVVTGGILVALGVAAWAVAVLAVAIVGLQYAVNPRLMQWLVPATIIPQLPDGSGYATAHPLGAIVARRCREAGIPLVRLGIVNDGMPNAFTFGHVQADARVWVTRGLLDRLDERELDAVVAHEIGHIKHHDFVVMTFAAGIPILAYYTMLTVRSARNRNSLPVFLAAYALYLVTTLVVLALARARETAADHHSCAVTGDGDALCSALVKIAYGMGQVKAERRARSAALIAQAKAAGRRDRTARRALARESQRQHRIDSMRPLGISDPNQAAAIVLAAEEGIAPHEVLGALRWEAVSPWGRFQELLSSHPIVVHRIAALERSGLAGAPKNWHAVDVEAAKADPAAGRARRRFPFELFIRFASTIALLGVLLGWAQHSARTIGWALLAGGVLLAIKAVLKHPAGPFQPVDRVTSLLPRLDASPVRGLPVSLRGRIIGRAMPGYVLSPDLVLQDGSGFVPLLYSQPVPFSRALFAMLRAGGYANQEVIARGWYRRSPAPYVELKDIVAADGRRSRSWQWAYDYVAAAALAVVGLLTVLVQLGVR
ncbi:MAG TPA: M48 family metalloprotease, partial [Actinomycetota bacterium]|nr:M48 family metalloprotease [Actinomycetota bacterium]